MAASPTPTPTVPPPARPGASTQAQARTPLRERFGYYLLGVALGLVMLGVVTMGKRLLAPPPKPLPPVTVPAPPGTPPTAPDSPSNP